MLKYTYVKYNIMPNPKSIAQRIFSLVVTLPLLRSRNEILSEAQNPPSCLFYFLTSLPKGRRWCLLSWLLCHQLILCFWTLNKWSCIVCIPFYLLSFFEIINIVLGNNTSFSVLVNITWYKNVLWLINPFYC